MASDELDCPRELAFPDDVAELLAMPGVLTAVTLSTDTPSGWCPFAIRQPTPNFWRGHVDRAAVVAHVTDAGWASVVSWFKNPASERSAHFQVRKDGTIDQFVSTDDSAWANGASYNGQTWVDPQGHLIRPTWPLLTPPTNPNRRTISVEHEGRPSEPWTAAQRTADTKLDRWLASQYPSLAPFVAGRTLIRHADISPVSKPNCPGKLVDLNERAAAANGESPTPADPFAAWGPIDKPDEVSARFAIPQTWLKNKATLGACLRGERYDIAGAVSRALFVGGEIRYLAWLKVAEVLPYPRPVPATEEG
jgi:N-acetylmuramoyl-L-alanine amidase-like protein